MSNFCKSVCKSAGAGAGPAHRGSRALGAGTAVVLAAVLVATLGAGGAGASTAPAAWLCRASAVYASLNGNDRVEPVVANGNANSLGGSAADEPQCATDNTGPGDLAASAGLPSNFLSAQTATASTQVTPEPGSAYQQASQSAAHVENLSVQLPPGQGSTTLGVAAANAQASARCVGGRPALTASSALTGLTVNGKSTSADQLASQLSASLKPAGDLARVAVDEQVTGPSSLIQRALQVDVINSSTGASVVDLVVGEASVGSSGAVCTPPSGAGGGNGSGGPNGGPSGSASAFEPNGYVPLSSVSGGNGSPGSGSGSGSNGGANNGSGSSNGGPGTVNGTAFGLPGNRAYPTCGRLTLYFVTGPHARLHRRATTSRYGVRQVVRGRLVTCAKHGAKPIVNAKVDVIDIVRGRRHLQKTGLKSRPGGRLTLILPMNLTTRNIQFAYRPNLLAKKASSQVTLKLTVRSRRGRIVR